MAISIVCSNSGCRKAFRAKDEHAGKKIKCPQCGMINRAIPPDATPKRYVEAEPEPVSLRAEKPPERPSPGRSSSGSPTKRAIWPWFAVAGFVVLSIGIAVILIFEITPEQLTNNAPSVFLAILIGLTLGAGLGGWITHLSAMAQRLQLEAQIAAYAEEKQWIERSEKNLRETFDRLLSASEARFANYTQESSVIFQKFTSRSLKELEENSRIYRKELTDQSWAIADEYSKRVNGQLTSHFGQVSVLTNKLETNLNHTDKYVRELESKREKAYADLRQTYEAFNSQALGKLTNQSRANADEFANRINGQLTAHAGQIDILKNALETNLSHLDQYVRELEAKREGAYVHLRETFEAFASQSLVKLTDQSRANADEFSGKVGTQLTSHADRIGLLKSALESNIEKMDVHVRALEEKRVGAYTSLTETVTSLKTACHDILAATLELNTALKVGPGRGRWGEIQLRKVVEMAGMVEHVSFDEQPAGDDGKPDMVVRLPKEGNISIDSKFLAKSYFEATQAADAETRKLKLDEHSQSLRQTIKELSQKTYWEQFQPSPEIVIMFIPLEACLMAAYENDPDIIEFALTQKVILASPITLLGFLKSIAFGWQQFKFSNEARKILEQGKELYKRADKWMDFYRKTGERINATVDAYNASVASLQQRFYPAARRFQELTGIQNELTEASTVDQSTSVPPLPEAVDEPK